jgi:hypothetical protein
MTRQADFSMSSAVSHYEPLQDSNQVSPRDYGVKVWPFERHRLDSAALVSIFQYTTLMKKVYWLVLG